MAVNRRLVVAALLVAGAATSAAPALAASGGTVARYQVTTTNYKIDYSGYEHDYSVTTNPCTGSVAITGSTPSDSYYATTESLTATVTGGILTYASTYLGPGNPGYTYGDSFPVTGGALGSGNGTAAVVNTSGTSYANHGAYVSANPGADAAHSCIGMPVQNNG